MCVPPRGELRDARDAGNDGLDEPGVCRDPFSEGCAGPPDDGEGYGGCCGSRADRLNVAGVWSWAP